MIENTLAAVYPGDEEESVVSPTREGRSTDASRLNLPIGWVAGIVVFFVGVAGSQAYNTSGMRSDVRDILTRMEMQSRISEADKRSQDMIFETTSKTVEQLRAQVQLLQLQYAEISKQITPRR